MAYQIRLRRNIPRGIAPALAEPVLDGGLFKVGDGATPVEHLPALGSLTDLPRTSWEHHQEVPLALWTIPNPLPGNAAPTVSIYVGGELVEADVTMSGSAILVEFPTPQTGIVRLT